jgi:hypothetical protein
MTPVLITLWINFQKTMNKLTRNIGKSNRSWCPNVPRKYNGLRLLRDIPSARCPVWNLKEIKSCCTFHITTGRIAMMKLINNNIEFLEKRNFLCCLEKTRKTNMPANRNTAVYLLSKARPIESPESIQ